MSLKRALEESMIPFLSSRPRKASFVKKDIPDHLKLGVYGEDLACEYLRSIGYRIIDRNKRYRTGEIDIISSYLNDIVFVEVRTRKENPYMPADTTVGPEKIRKLTSAVRKWVEENEFNGYYRIDLIAITIKKDKSYSIEHIKGITEVMI